MADAVQKLHPDPDVSCTLTRLDVVLEDWLRNTGEATTVIVIPHSRSTPMHVVMEGQVKDGLTGPAIMDAVARALRLRGLHARRG